MTDQCSVSGVADVLACLVAAVDGGWSRWSPWSRCDKRCGGGRSIRTRSCSSPPPKNGGKKCEGEKNQVKPCNTKPCGELHQDVCVSASLNKSLAGINSHICFVIVLCTQGFVCKSLCSWQTASCSVIQCEENACGTVEKFMTLYFSTAR